LKAWRLVAWWRLGWLAGVTVDRVVAQLAQFGQRFSIGRTVCDLLGADDVSERRDEDGVLADLQEDRVLAQLLVAGEVPAAVAGDAQQDVDVAGVGALRRDLRAGEHDAVEWYRESLGRCVGAAQAGAELPQGAGDPVEVLAIPGRADVEIRGRALGAVPLRGQSTDRDERDLVAFECADQCVGIERRRVGVAHGLAARPPSLGSYSGQPWRAANP
jgi:hypothetical protein